MPASPRLIDLAERKRCLVLRADLHRQLIALERSHLQSRCAAVQKSIADHRWWWVGGAVLAGWLLTRRLGGVMRWLPAVVTIARVARSVRG